MGEQGWLPLTTSRAQGLVLFPDLDGQVYTRRADPFMKIEGGEDSPDISKLHHAYLLWNTFDACEFAVKVPTELAGGGLTMHFSEVLRLPATNEVFSLDSDDEWARL